MEKEGLPKLVEYLNQTRRQAENAIDSLNVKVTELQSENDTCLSMITKLESERDHFKKLSEQLKAENSTKWKLQERDEWKALVDSVQKDRSRLQEECTSLENEVEECHSDIQWLQDEIKRYAYENEQLIMTIERNDAANNTNGELRMAEIDDNEGRSSHLNSPQPSHHGSRSGTPSFLPPPSSPGDRRASGNYGSLTPISSPEHTAIGQSQQQMLSTPNTSAINQLKHELRRTQSQLETEKREREIERLSFTSEIRRLKEELNAKNSLTNQNGITDDSSNVLSSSGIVSSTTNSSSVVASKVNFGYWLKYFLSPVLPSSLGDSNGMLTHGSGQIDNVFPTETGDGTDVTKGQHMIRSAIMRV